MAFYKTGYSETLELPVDTFWMLHKNIDRIEAEMSHRELIVFVHAQSEKGVEKFMEQLEKIRGKPIEFDEAEIALERAQEEYERDREKLLSLKGKGGIISKS